MVVADGWISVKDKLPYEFRMVLVAVKMKNSQGMTVWWFAIAFGCHCPECRRRKMGMHDGNNATRFICVLLSLDDCYNLEDEFEIRLIKDDIISEVSCCWHMFNIDDIRIVDRTILKLFKEDCK